MIRDLGAILCQGFDRSGIHSNGAPAVVDTNLPFLILMAARTFVAFLWPSFPLALPVLSFPPEPTSRPTPEDSISTGERPARLVAVSALESARPSLLREVSMVVDGTGPAMSG